MLSVPKNWKPFLLAPQNVRLLQYLLATIQPKQLAEIYKSSFSNAHDPRSLMWLGVALSKTRAENIIEHAATLLDNHKGFIESVIDTWLETIIGTSENRMLDVDFKNPRFHLVIAELNIHAPTSIFEAPSWSYINDMAEQLIIGENALLDKVIVESERIRAVKELEKLTQQLITEEAKRKNIRQKLQQERQRVVALETELEVYRQSDIQLQKQFEKYIQETTRQQEDYVSLQKRYQQDVHDLTIRLSEVEQQKTTELSVLQFSLTREVEERQEQLGKMLVQLQELTEELETYRNQKSVLGFKLPDDSDFSNALIIDYELLGDESLERVLKLLTVYQAYIDNSDTYLLQSKTNILSIDLPPQGLLLLGLETFLQDCITLPIRRYLKLSTFTSESLVTVLNKGINRTVSS